MRNFISRNFAIAAFATRHTFTLSGWPYLGEDPFVMNSTEGALSLGQSTVVMETSTLQREFNFISRDVFVTRTVNKAVCHFFLRADTHNCSKKELLVL